LQHLQHAETEWEDPDGEPWMNVLPGGVQTLRQIRKGPPMPRHCLNGYIPEEPSTEWLHPEGDAVVQRFRGASQIALEHFCST
jgi:hypothetical protein